MNGKKVKYTLSSLDYIKSLTRNKDLIAYLNDTKDAYIGLTIDTAFCDHNARLYRVEQTKFIDKFNNMLNKEGLGLLLLNSNGKMDTELTVERCFQLLNVYRKSVSLDDESMKRISEIATEVSNMCMDVLKVPASQIKKFRNLLKDYVRIDLIVYGLGQHKSSIVKVQEGLDYKISRIFKMLGIEVELKLIPDFKIEYNNEQVDLTVNDFPQMNQVKSIKEKSKVLVNTKK